MIRNVVGSILALAGATAAVWSPFRAWYDGRHGRDYPIEDLFTGITDAKADVMASILLPFLFAALLTLAGVVFRSRWLVALAGLVVLGFTILWMVRVGQAEGGLTIESDGRGLGDGVANALGGGVLLLIGAVVMSGRRPHATRVDRTPRPDHAPHPPYDAGRGPDEPYGREHPPNGQERGPYGREHPPHESERPPYAAPPDEQQTRTYPAVPPVAWPPPEGEPPREDPPPGGGRPPERP
ncbi:hypothetical protein [Streptomyces roseicoloratus]|uniref:hypothetical protein n=1 Tax=Streptomyces roseicoloratus TaxID=2508722 RepID=UPI001FE8407D|nr:hypothetical protein [Streptomyces roseicoloratus]